MPNFLKERKKLMDILSDSAKRASFAQNCKATLQAEGMPYDSLDPKFQRVVDYLCALSEPELKVLADTNDVILGADISPESSQQKKLGRAV
jgi:hypothetical protein